MSSFQKLRVVVMALPTDDCCDMLKFLPSEATVIAKGKNLEEMNTDAALNNEQLANAECLLVVTGGGSSLGSVINAMKALKWIHGIFAGLDHLSCPEFDNCSRDRNIVVTNAKGVFSSSLAEWVMGSIWYFNKDIPRLNRNKDNKSYERYFVLASIYSILLFFYLFYPILSIILLLISMLLSILFFYLFYPIISIILLISILIILILIISLHSYHLYYLIFHKIYSGRDTW